VRTVPRPHGPSWFGRLDAVRRPTTGGVVR
jgi:hypothetical protein